jgi:hypothetical protein
MQPTYCNQDEEHDPSPDYEAARRIW